MPKTETVHFNPSTTKGFTRCGRALRKVKRWTEDSDDATCNSCLNLIEKDKS